MSQKIQVLIADDSVVYRSQIRSALLGIEGVEIIGAVGGGKHALERMALTDTDLLILDLEMPEMDGLEVLRQMRERRMKAKVLLFSATTKKASEITLEALKLGASEFVTKPGPGQPGTDPAMRIREVLAPHVKGLFPGESESHFERGPSTAYARTIWDLFHPQVTVIGSSTGGPSALEYIFSRIRGPLRCPIIIAQHMPPIFTATLAERIQRICGVETREAVHGEALENRIYIAPGDYHVRLERRGTDVTIRLDQDDLINYVRPAVDPLFATAASLFRDRTLGIVLTGMGQDGRVGAEQIKSAGGSILIQDRESSIVYGMPGAVMSAGAYDLVMNLDEMTLALQQKTMAQAPVDFRSAL